jgi:hypothetical protein
MAANDKAAAKRPTDAVPAEVETRASKLRARFAKAIPNPRCELDHQNAWQLLVVRSIRPRDQLSA